MSSAGTHHAIPEILEALCSIKLCVQAYLIPNLKNSLRTDKEAFSWVM